MLEKLYKHGYVYDIEIYKNLFCLTTYSLATSEYKTYLWYEDVDDRRDLANFITTNPILISFNGWNFDDAVLVHLLRHPNITKLELWQFAQTLINGERNPYRYDLPFVSYDVLEVLRAGFNITSLKMCGVNLKHHRIQELPIHYLDEVRPDQLNLLIDYNKNDLDITYKVLEYLKPRLEMRELLSENYKLNLNSLSDSGIGKELFRKLYVDKVKAKNPRVDVKRIKYSRTVRETIDFKDVINPVITFKTPQLQEYLTQLKEIKLV